MQEITVKLFMNGKEFVSAWEICKPIPEGLDPEELHNELLRKHNEINRIGNTVARTIKIELANNGEPGFEEWVTKKVES